MKTNKNKISKILALAFFESEEKVQRTHLLALQKIEDLLKKIPKLAGFLESPMFSLEEKEVFFSLLNLPKSVDLFLKLVTEKRLISHLSVIVGQYEDLLYSSLKQTKARVVVAHPVSKSTEKLIREKLETLINQKILLTVEIDPSILGGVQIETKDLYLDASLKKALANMRNSL